MWLIPLSKADVERVVRRAYSIAAEHAKKVGARVEQIAPKHLYGEKAESYGYSLALGRMSPPLPDASLVVIWGFYNADEYFDYVRFAEGSRVVEWFVEPVAYYPEKTAVWADEPLVLHSGFAIETHTTASEQRDRVYGWPLGFISSPKQAPAPVRPPRKMRQKRQEGGEQQ